MHENPGRTNRGWTMKLGGGVAMAAALALAGCAPDYVTGSSATVLLAVSAINGGSPIASDVRGDSGEITNCLTIVSVSETVKNPNNAGNSSENVTLSRYDVAFRRADGRAVEGVDVPYRFSGSMTFTLKPGEVGKAITIDLVRQQAKLEPPLSNITGVQLVEMTADVTVYGQTVSGQNVMAKGSADVRFADYATGTKTCESGS
jgi:hypothetical protein